MTTNRTTQETAPSAAKTREALIDAALTLFGTKGFAATSTREIAAAAKANIGSIAYHFGSKEGLRDACARHIVDTVQTVAGPILASPLPSPETGGPAADELLRAILERMIGFLVVQPEAGRIAQFILREMSQPTPALDIVYSGVFEPVHRRLCRIWELATGEPAESERTKLAVFTMIGQVIYFRIGREAVLRRMGWASIGSEEAARIAEVAGDNLMAALAARKEDKP
ncbi:CerR family C-terminal domain-containing protein [Aquamicrobium sp. LC103]|uniref:CerR family C-terminal domain-containing protein n=1 Tax=Aquamicrobium sp. LC103 TaxID=1120658 RepID=UPI001FEEAAFE|nr:CerR family C-terminal domain-containing protein [Aquamicrobium sp. LC103]